jgi:hypothetical protein
MIGVKQMSFVFESDIAVQYTEMHRRQYELDDETMATVLAGISKDDNLMGIDIDELRDLLNGRGEISTLIATTGNQAEVTEFLRKIASQAWEQHVPWKLEQAESISRDDGRFEEFVRAYVKIES